MDLLIKNIEGEQSYQIDVAGRIDSTNASRLEKTIDDVKAAHLVLNLNECVYISSAGLRVLLSAHKRISAIGGTFMLINVPDIVSSVFDVTGLNSIFMLRRKADRISFNDMTLLSAGACGECYRLDSERVIKLYKSDVAPEIAFKEKEFARAALIAGIPTAISYEVVQIEERTGIVYEMLDAELFSDIIKKDWENVDAYAKTLCNIMQNIHNIHGDSKLLPDLKVKFREYIDKTAAFLPSEDVLLLSENLAEVPESPNCVHFDIHTSNIMIKDDEPYIIDLGDFSTGSYLFDVGLVDIIYGYPELDICETVTRIPNDQGRDFRNLVVDEYFASRSADERLFYEKNRYFLASLRAIYTFTFLPNLQDKMIFIIKDFLLPKIKAQKSFSR